MSNAGPDTNVEFKITHQVVKTAIVLEYTAGATLKEHEPIKIA